MRAMLGEYDGMLTADPLARDRPDPRRDSRFADVHLGIYGLLT
jgi:hypothetical protein